MLSCSLPRTARSNYACFLYPSLSSVCCKPVSTTSARQVQSNRAHQRRPSSSSSSSSSSSKPPGSASGSSGSNNDAAQQAASSSAATVSQQKKPTASVSSLPSSRLGRRRAKTAASHAHSMSRQATVAIRSIEQLNLPSVPSTHHLHPADVAASAFFSLHRPISVTAVVPSPSTSSAFNSIFTHKPSQSDDATSSSSSPSHRPTTVIATLSSTIDALSHPNDPSADLSPDSLAARQGNIFAQQQHDENDFQIQAAAAAAQSPLQLPKHLLSGKYRPFMPPPPPSPPTVLPSTSDPTQEPSSLTHSSSADAASSQCSTPTTRQRAYSAHVTIIVTANDHDERVHQPPSAPNSLSTPSSLFARGHSHPNARTIIDAEDFAAGGEEGEIPSAVAAAAEHMVGEALGRAVAAANANLRNAGIVGGHVTAGRVAGWRASGDARARRGGIMHAISVRRQRKLKMKKHKFKKLMRRTRTLRKKLEK